MKEATPRVSVVIPAFNAADFIAPALRSASTQTEERIEIIVVDDCSADETTGIVEEMSDREPRIRLLRMARNSGPAAARNRGFDAARGEWIALLDADDRYLPQRLEKLLTLAEMHDADMASDNLMLCSGGEEARGAPMIPTSLLPAPKRLGAAEYFERNTGGPRGPRVSYGFMQPLFRRAFLEKHGLRYEERNRFGEDFLLCIACLMKGARWWVTPEPLYLYTVRAGSLAEVQSAADLSRIREAELALLGDPAVRVDRALTGAIRRHNRMIARNYYYRAFTDAVKGSDYGRASTLLFDSSESLRLIVEASFTQAPTIIGKAARGGYRKSAALCGREIPAPESLAMAVEPRLK